MHPRKYSRRLKRLSLGMPPCIPFFINNYQFVPRCTIFLSLHALCAMLGASRSLLFLVCFALFVVVTMLEPNMLDWERYTLHFKLKHLIGFSYLFFAVSCSLSCLSCCPVQFLCFRVFFQSFCFVSGLNFLQFACLSCLESLPVALSCVS